MLSHKFIIIAVSLAIWPLLSATAHAKHPSRSRMAIQSEYDKMDAAIAKKDLNVFFSRFSPDYVSVDASGKKLGKTGNREALEQLCSRIRSITIISTVKDSVQIRSRTTVKVNREMTMMVFNPRTQQLIKAVSMTEYLDGWIQTKNKGWLLRTNKILSRGPILSAPVSTHTERHVRVGEDGRAAGIGKEVCQKSVEFGTQMC